MDTSTSVPVELLSDVPWSFSGQPHSSCEAFSVAIGEYLSRIGQSGVWNPDALVLAQPKVLVTYSCWRGDEEFDPVVELTSEGVAGFTASELLFKLHNAVLGDMAETDHHFFEGLRLNSKPVGEVPPLYIVQQGS